MSAAIWNDKSIISGIIWRLRRNKKNRDMAGGKKVKSQYPTDLYPPFPLSPRWLVSEDFVYECCNLE
jgi:hypothetical protein